jgi:hypothetical protein
MVTNPETSVSTGVAYEAAHAVDKGDPKVDGPYLDDLPSHFSDSA